MGQLVLALAAFVGTHLLASWKPLRDRLIARLGEGAFRGLYSLVALGTLVWAVRAYRPLPEPALWAAGPGAYHPAALVMLFASVLFVGSFTPANRALAGVPAGDRAPAGVLGITRHPMMWAFAIWAAVHGALAGDAPTLALTAAVATLALVGSAMQDGRKAGEPGWDEHRARTGFVPFAAQLAGRRPWRDAWPGWLPVLGGLAFWLALTWIHPGVMGAPVVGLWEWLA